MSLNLDLPTSLESPDRHCCSALMQESIEGHEADEHFRSRSTSAGSRTHALHDDADMAFVVRNTFIENVVGRAASLEGFFHEREIHSCPASRPTSVDATPAGLEAFLEDLGHAFVELPGQAAAGSQIGRPLSLDDLFFEQRDTRACPVSWGTPSDSITLHPMLKRLLSGIEEGQFETQVDSPVESPRFAHGEVPCAAATIASLAVFPMILPGPPIEHGPVLYQGVETLPSFALAAFEEPPRLVCLAGAIPDRTVGSLDMPTVGSIGHHSGDCKPCAFLYAQGCSNGVHCAFCHLCSPGEKKRRKHVKKDLRRQAHAARCRRDLPCLPQRFMAC